MAVVDTFILNLGKPVETIYSTVIVGSLLVGTFIILLGDYEKAEVPIWARWLIIPGAFIFFWGSTTFFLVLFWPERFDYWEFRHDEAAMLEYRVIQYMLMAITLGVIIVGRHFGAKRGQLIQLSI